MVSVLLIWGYIFITTFYAGACGDILLRDFCRKRTQAGMPAPFHIRKVFLPEPLLHSMLGLMIMTVYAQIWSLFGGVGAMSNGVLLLLLPWEIFFVRRQFRPADTREKEQGRAESSRTGSVWKGIAAAAAILLYAYGCSRGIIHVDTSLYHAQSIRWVETWGAVPGLVNLHNRLGYNSAAFPLSALYSFHFLGGQSFHCAAGYMAMLLFLECGKILRIFSRGKHSGSSGAEKAEKERQGRPADFVRLAGIYYLLTIFDEMISPASDYFMVCAVFYIMIRFLEITEKQIGEEMQEEEYAYRYALLTMLSVWTVTVKLSAVMMLLLALRPLYLYWKNKKNRDILLFTLLGVFVALPFLIRNVILTGYLLYPWPALDLFHVPWKISAGYALSDQREILVWGRGYTDAARYGEPLSYWIGNWFRGQTVINKMCLLAAAASVPVAGVFFLRHCKERIRLYALPVLTAAAGLAFWFHSSPLIRYGCVFPYMTAASFAGILWKEWKYPAKSTVLTGLVILFFVWKGIGFGKELTGGFRNEYWILQKDYEKYECTPYERDGLIFWASPEGGRTGYDAFPASPFPAGIRLRDGKSLKNGFLPE